MGYPECEGRRIVHLRRTGKEESKEEEKTKWGGLVKGTDKEGEKRRER